MDFDYDGAIARIPRWIFGVAAVGTPIAFAWKGLPQASGFLAGALASWVNFKLIERAVNRLARGGEKRPSGGSTRIFIRFAFLLLGAFAILNVSGFSVAAGFVGFLVCPAAVILEIVYELISYGHS